MRELVSVRVVTQRHASDCLICCLAMLLGASYEAVLLAVSKVKPESGTHGLYWTDAAKAAKQLGARVKVRHRYCADDVTGIVDLVPVGTRIGQPHHCAMLIRGVLIDPAEPTVWPEPEAYEAANNYTLGAVMIRT